MTKLMSVLAGAAVLVVGLTTIETPAVAQNSVSEIIVYGTDACPRSTDDQVVVCARKPESERYRIPEKLRSTGTPQQRESWATRAKVLETVGDTGINSCSPVGPGGFTGCLTQVVKEARQQRRQQAEDYNPER
ncbi:MAG: hypothetical protein ABIS38_06275 [Sphingomicrobium sp.]